ncbi:MAG: cytochrome c oxidase assembly protein [Chloroflexota bacterium]
MNAQASLLQALLSKWEWRIEVVLVLLLFGVLFFRGWWILRSRGAVSATKLRLVAYFGGLFSLALSLMSPIDWLGGQLFFMHMVQHMLSIMIGAPLLCLANPFPILVWGLPSNLRLQVGQFFTKQSRFRQVLVLLTRPQYCWFFFFAVYLGWHEPAAYNLALRRGWVHDLEHLTFFASAMLFWWHGFGVAPKFHKPLPVWGRLAFLLSAIPPNMLAGVMIAFSNTVIYTYYESIPRVWGLTLMQDQRLGGAIMWIPGSMMFLIAGIVVLALGLQREHERNKLVHVPGASTQA